MLQIDKKKLGDGSLHLTLSGKIDEKFDGQSVVDAGTSTKVVVHLAGVRSISSLGVRQFELFLASLGQRDVVMIHISPAIANQIAKLCHCAFLRIGL